MKKIIFVTTLIISSLGFSQDLSMQDGTFTRCAPDKFFDSGGEFGPYGNNENFTTTICPPNADEFIILDFLDFSTQLNADVLTIYDGDDTTAAVLGTYSGVASPGTIIASDTNASGCLTITFTSNGAGNTTGWEADITCAVSCQTITPQVVSTTPVETSPNVVEILPGETVDFVGGATFSVDGTNATYSWNFGDGNTATGTNVSNTFTTSGTYLVTLTVQDDNPLGCQESITFFVNVLQAIVSVNNNAFPESSMSLPELVENVLVSGGCSGVDNFSFQVNGAPGDTGTKSYGYFTRGGAVNFPFEEGIIITSGVAAQAGNNINPNLVSNNNGQAGDADLENALGFGAGDTNDATFVKFNFVPTSNEISFRYLMASEEYDGSTECSFADGFAFLLREEGTVAYTNLAVLPDGTPVNVTNINNSGNCTDNPAFFEGYNIGETNYGGRTVVLTASATVIPNTTYEIKLVAADEGDSIWDSAIFLEAGSFNLGGDLGDDITIAAGTAECGGNAITLDTEAPTATHTWYYSPDSDDLNDATLINGETGPTINITDEGYYFVEVEFAPGCETSDSILVEFRPSPVANAASDLSICDADATAEFDLSENDDDVLGSQDSNDFTITYHLTEQDAIDNVGALPSNYINISNPQTIWVRIADDSQECFDTTSFQLLFSDLTIGNTISPLQVCDGDITDGIGTFTLTDRDAEIIGTNDPDDVTVTYHLNQADAENNASPLPTSYNNVTPNNQTIYARLEDNVNNECYAVTTLELEVLGNPVANMPMALEECDDDTDGFVEFDLSDRD
ncbi:choice-of-anchor L domain-containing protein, partial [Winogradskyella algicola]|uniref:choice-of-anchor L domain-containing protein n=1 Tax=Winogradskyella algicola TaxID=2575815 RepID=UPI001107DC1F